MMDKEKQMDMKTAVGLRDMFRIEAIEDVLLENKLIKSPGEIRERAKKKLAESNLTEEQKQFFKDYSVL